MTDTALPPPSTLEWLPADAHGQPPEQLILLLHGVGASAQGMAPLAQFFRQNFPRAAIVAADGFDPFDMAPVGRQWFSVQGVDEVNRVERVAAVLPRLSAWVKATQDRLRVGPAATALVGFSQGAILALELVSQHDGLAGRVLAFAGRYAQLPMHAPQATTLHLFHGEADAVIPVQHARTAIERLAARHGDATLDIASGVGHEIAPALLRCALQRLTTHIPHRTWAQALGAVPGLAGRDEQDPAR
ncbi:putative esterase [Burkholderiales bacterium JOSHI_001]|nr:putative esterase [Burkholderiales bacterium JOSHI_001]